MKIIPLNSVQQIAKTNLPVSANSFKLQKDTFEKTQNVQNPSFKENIYAKIINDSAMAKKFVGMLTLGIGALFTAANVGAEDADQGILSKDQDNDFFSLIIKSLQEQAKQTTASVAGDETELEKLRQRNAQLEAEISQLREQAEGSQHGDELKSVSDTDNPLIKAEAGEPISDGEIRVIGEEDTAETLSEGPMDSKDEQELIQFEFPRRDRSGALPSALRQLKAVSNGLLLSKEENEKYTEICKILLNNKEYTTPNDKKISCEGLAMAIVEQLTGNKELAGAVINTCYDKLGLGNKNPEKLENGVRADESALDPTQGDGNFTRGHATTTYKTLKENPIQPPKVLGRIDLGEQGKGWKSDKSTRKTTVRHTPSDPSAVKPTKPGSRRRIEANSPIVIEETPLASTGVVSTCDLSDPADEFSTRLDTTPSDPRISFPHFASGRIGNDLFAAPDAFVHDSPFGRNSSLRFRKDSAGEIAKILLDFEKYYDNLKGNEQRRENIKIWANNILFPPEDPSEEVDTGALRNVTLRSNTEKYIAENIRRNDLIQEITSKANEDYSNIKNAIYGILSPSENQINVRPDFSVLDDIVEAINSDERFKNFGFHGAIRLIERLVDFDSDISVQEQCSHILDVLFALIERALQTGVQVRTYMYVYDKQGKFGNIIVGMNPNIVIPKELYTPEERKMFQGDDLLISINEYQPKDEYNKSLKRPLIKTLIIQNAW